MGLTLLRHTRLNVAEGVCYGQLDLDVADSFEKDAEAALSALPCAPDTIISSPLERCQALAKMIAEEAQAPMQSDARLIEMDFGRWEGVAWEDIPRHELDAWAADFAHARPHGGESVAMLKARVDACIEDWKARLGSILIVTHAGVIRAALAPSLEQDGYNTRIPFGGHVVLA